jgi:hypothetical protein
MVRDEAELLRGGSRGAVKSDDRRPVVGSAVSQVRTASGRGSAVVHDVVRRGKPAVPPCLPDVGEAGSHHDDREHDDDLQSAGHGRAG